MKVTAQDLKKLGLIERIVPEEEPVCTDNLYQVAEYMDSAMAGFFERCLSMTKEELAKELLDYVLAVASGRKVKSEKAGFHDMAILNRA